VRSLVHREEEEQSAPSLSRQALWFLIHTVIALASWLGLMLTGYALNPPAVSQTLILGLSIFVPLAVGHLVARLHPDETAASVWLLGLIWLLIIGLWILYMPTGPDRCFGCNATNKLSRTLLSIPEPSGLIDDDGPFLCTWPVAALFGYSFGAWLAPRRIRSNKQKQR
jgi:hypothetical protein